MTGGAGRVALWLGVAVLCAVGIFSAVQRGVALAGDHAAFERMTVEGLAQLFRLQPGSPERARLEREIPASSANLVDHPRATFSHLIPGALLMLLAPLASSRSAPGSCPRTGSCAQGRDPLPNPSTDSNPSNHHGTTP